MSVGIHWFRRDLRLQDNIALHQACEENSQVIPLFIIDTKLINSKRIGAPRLQFLLNALRSVDESLQKYGTRLLVRHGNPQEILPDVVKATGAKTLYFNRDYSPYAEKRDSAIEQALDIPLCICDDAILMQPGSILKKDGKPYTVYTYFWKKWKTTEKPKISEWDFSADHFYDLSDLENDGIPTMSDLGFEDVDILPDASEAVASQALEAFLQADIKQYDEKRNWLPINPFAENRPEGTSYLSPYLRLGLLSPRQAYWAARATYANTISDMRKNSIETWVSELAWREFYMHILHFFPHVIERDFVDTYQSLEWREAPDELQAWKDGKIGYPVVDAAMRQLKTIGWMPNRARMIVASFLTKDLLIHWQHGELHFMRHLLDGDPAANNGGWQWAAGTGTDAQPYFRIFNPVSQSKKFATPVYLRYWIPELKEVPDKYIHEPWEMQNPPADYPPPIVDHKMARERTLTAFKAARGE